MFKCMGSVCVVCQLSATICTPESQNGDGSKFEESTRAAAG